MWKKKSKYSEYMELRVVLEREDGRCHGKQETPVKVPGLKSHLNVD
jgi:hypothetical protein